MKKINLENIHFRKSFFGYKSKNVDIFTEKLVDGYNNLIIENNRLRDDLYDLKKREDQITKTLISAQNTSDKMILDAKKEAKSIITHARKKSKSIIEKTEEELDAEKNTIYKNFYNSERELTMLLEEFYSLSRKHMDNLESEFMHKIKKKISTFNRSFDNIAILKNDIIQDIKTPEQRSIDTTWKDKEYAVLLGQHIKMDILNSSKEVIFSKNTIITPDIIDNAIKKGYYGELVSSIDTKME